MNVRASAGPNARTPGKSLLPRWIFLRALGLIFFSAFYSLNRQILGLVGSKGILPASSYLEQIAKAVPGPARFYYAPTLLWFNSSDTSLMTLSWVGMTASALVIANIFPRTMIALCEILFLSFIGVSQDFGSYQSDGMLLEAGFISVFLAPRGFRPGLGEKDPPSPLLIYLLLWEWFRIYFESGIVKLLSHDEQWHNLTAMDHYYENGPLPSWLGWYAQERLPENFHRATAAATLGIELGLVWLAWLPRRFRLACFAITSALQIGIILTANYAFLNYLVFSLGFLLLDDQAFYQMGFGALENVNLEKSVFSIRSAREAGILLVFLAIFYTTVVSIPGLEIPDALTKPVQWLSPFRIANSYGLFAVMTPSRYEIEFQGSDDEKNWIAYPFRYKPQDLNKAPGIYAPYQPRFDWNLWFASLGSWQNCPWVVNVEGRLLENSEDVLSLFAANPFPNHPPKFVRAVIYQYWFTTPAEKSETGNWWKRELLGLYAPKLRYKPAS